MTIDDVANLLAEDIQRLYAEPWWTAADAGELDTVLRVLHWWYAKVTDQLDRFASIRAKEPAELFLVRMKWRKSHASTEEPGVAELIDAWKTIDQSPGWNWPARQGSQD